MSLRCTLKPYFYILYLIIKKTVRYNVLYVLQVGLDVPLHCREGLTLQGFSMRWAVALAKRKLKKRENVVTNKNLAEQNSHLYIYIFTSLTKLTAMVSILLSNLICAGFIAFIGIM